MEIIKRLSAKKSVINFLSSLGLIQGDVNETIILIGSPRSGTTWLAELLSEIPEYNLLDEPLHLNHKQVEEAGIDEWRKYLAYNQSYPLIKSYLHNVLSGTAIANRHFSSDQEIGKMSEFLYNKKYVVKFVRANRMINWIGENFEVRGKILLLRHPCAVVASQLNSKHKGWRKTEVPNINNLQNGFGGKIPEKYYDRFKPILANVKSSAGRLAAVWCLDNFFPLYERNKFQGFITTYEKLFLDEKSELLRIFQYLDYPIPDKAIKKFDVKSYSASKDLITDNKRQQLAKWREKLSKNQINEILTIVQSFGLNFYTESLEPDYSQISNLY